MRLAPEVYTSKVQESTDFYCKHLGFQIKQKLEGFVVLQHAENPVYEILFCVPNSPFVDSIFRPAYSGQGLIFQMEVDNVDEIHTRLQREGVPIVLQLKTEDINGRHFTITDPNGILIDIVQFI